MIFTSKIWAMRIVKKIIIGLSVMGFILLMGGSSAFSYQRTLTLTDKEIVERLTKLEEGQRALRENLTILREDINKRFEDIDKRFEDIDKRFEDIDKRFEDINRRFEDINRRFDSLDKRIGDLTSVMNTMMVVFGGLVVALMGLVFWDRRTLIKKAKDEAVEDIETNSRLINALRELAKTDKRLADVMKSFGLL